MLAASMVLPVGIAVASNQILNNGKWNWWWGALAVALTTVSTLVTYHLTDPSPTAAFRDSAQATWPVTDGTTGGGKASQIVKGSTAGGDITQVREAGGSVRIVRDRAATRFSPPPAPPTPDPSVELPAQDAGSRPSGGDQMVTGSHAGGSIDQIIGVQGDVDIQSS
ncbi:hypothetical protein [Sphaerisporangium flaviroseum]|uniref:hypothetical protein n=1 Tax=Sphaerisporangium flaviroseum TaxID=509199 RepID=UPI0031E73461